MKTNLIRHSFKVSSSIIKSHIRSLFRTNPWLYERPYWTTEGNSHNKISQPNSCWLNKSQTSYWFDLQESNLIPDPVAKIKTVGYASGGWIRSISKPLPMTWLISTTLPLFKPHRTSAVEPATLLTKNSNAPRVELNDGGDAIARKVGLEMSARRSWRYCPAHVWDSARSGASETSIDMWKRDCAAGSTSVRGTGVQTVVSWRTAAAATVAKRRLWGFRRRKGRRRRTDMEWGGVLTCAWGGRGGRERVADMIDNLVREEYMKWGGSVWWRSLEWAGVKGGQDSGGLVQRDDVAFGQESLDRCDCSVDGWEGSTCHVSNWW